MLLTYIEDSYLLHFCNELEGNGKVLNFLNLDDWSGIVSARDYLFYTWKSVMQMLVMPVLTLTFPAFSCPVLSIRVAL